MHDCSHDIENLVHAAEIESKTKQVSLVKVSGYTGIRLFPYILQKIIATENSKLAIRLEQNIPVPIHERLPNGLYTCNCLFLRRYRLPCQHAYHIDRDARVSDQLESMLTDNIWVLSSTVW